MSQVMPESYPPRRVCTLVGTSQGMVARMTDTHRTAALDALAAATVARKLVSQEYNKAPHARDYNLIGELRASAKFSYAEAEVHALLAPRAVLVVDNAHDALQALRNLA